MTSRIETATTEEPAAAGAPTAPETDFYILAWGLVAATVCTSLSVEDAASRLNRELPTGISSRWSLSDDKTFSTGEPMPQPCETFPTHTHYLFNC